MTTVTISTAEQTFTTTTAAMIAAGTHAPSRAPARARAHARGTTTASPTRDRAMADDDTIHDKGSIAAQELRLFVERLERLEEEVKGLNDDKKDVYSELKGRGYDTAIVKKVLGIRRKKKGEHEEEQMVLDTYLAALGMI